MYCPSCKSEFRPGFTRCVSCGVDLVEDLDAASPQTTGTGAPAPTLTGGVSAPMVSYCGFLDLDEAREARERLRGAGIRSEIVIRDAPEEPEKEEYWLRVPHSRVDQVTNVLDDERDR